MDLSAPAYPAKSGAGLRGRFGQAMAWTGQVLVQRQQRMHWVKWAFPPLLIWPTFGVVSGGLGPILPPLLATGDILGCTSSQQDTPEICPIHKIWL